MRTEKAWKKLAGGTKQRRNAGIRAGKESKAFGK